MFDRNSFPGELASCACRNKQSDPFFFPIRQQRVLLLSACPSLQTVSSSLLSVRFVRQMLYALLGEDGVSDTGISLLFAKKGLYWTHFNKCYCEQFFRRDRQDGTYLLESLPAECAKKYFERELELLSKSLKLVIVMGKQTCTSAAAYIDAFRSRQENAGNPVEIIEIDYLQNEPPAKYDALRKKVAAALGREAPADLADSLVLDTAKTRMRVGLDMELVALDALATKRMGQTESLLDGVPAASRLDKMWIDRVVLPQKERQSILLSAWSAIESSLTAFLADALDPVSQKSPMLRGGEWLSDVVNRTHQGMRIDRRTAMFRDRLFTLRNSNMLYLMDQFVTYLSRGRVPEKYSLSLQMRNDWSALSESLKLLRYARNVMIHRGGFFAIAELERQDAPANANTGYNRDYQLRDQFLDSESDFVLSGINIITNTMYLSDEAPAQILELTGELFKFIIRLDEHLSKR